MWKLKSKYFPKKRRSLPVAKVNEDGHIITNKNELKHLYLKHYSHGMTSRPIKFDLKTFIYETEESLFKVLEKTKLDKSPD